MAWEERYQKEMLRRLRGRLIQLGIPDVKSLMRGLEIDIERIIAGNSKMVEDERTRPHLRLAVLVLASYQTLCSIPLERQQAIEIVEDVFAGIGRTMLRLYTLALLTFSRDPFTAITHAGKSRALQQYGREWEFRIEETDSCFSMTATRCFYADFFRAVDAPQLTRVFCRWDQNWIEPINPARHKINFNRPVTIGYGGRECPFIFTRIE